MIEDATLGVADGIRPPTDGALLWRVARHAGWWLALAAVTALALAGLETALPAVLGRAVDAAVGRAPRSWVLWLGLLVAILAAADVLDDLASGYGTAASTAWLRRSLTRHILRLSPGASGFSPGEVVNRMVGNTADASRIGSYAVRALANLVPAVGGTVALALIDVWLFVAFMAGLPVAVLLVRYFAKDIAEVLGRYLEVQGRIAGRLVAALSGARSIAAAGTLQREAGRVLAPLPELHRSGMAMWRAQTRVLTQDALLTPLLELAVLTVAGFELSKGRITVGAMLAAGQYVLLGATFTSAIGTVTQLARARTAARRTADILDQPPLPSGTKELPPGDGALTVDGVSVHLSGAAVLEGIDLSIAAGTFVAVVGRSGSGKSLLAAVLGRLVVPTEGQVLLDGVELTSLDERVLRSAVAYGFERPFLIGETIEDAIAFGEPTPDLRRVVAAAREARADDFVRRLPLGYQSALSDAPMSAGELQRLGVARAFAHAGRVLILDDVVSSLDTVTEHHIAEALACGLPQLTRVVIAHRVSTAAQADTVIWLERGRLRGMASHADLWQQPDYRALFEPDEAAPPAGNSELEHSS